MSVKLSRFTLIRSIAILRSSNVKNDAVIGESGKNTLRIC